MNGVEDGLRLPALTNTTVRLGPETTFCCARIIGKDSELPVYVWGGWGRGALPNLWLTLPFLKLKASFPSSRVKSLDSPDGTCLLPGAWLTPKTDSTRICREFWIGKDFPWVMRPYY